MAWRPNQLRRIANAMNTGIEQSRVYRGNDRGSWLDIAHVAEQVAEATTVASTNISGSMARTVAALESLSGTSGTGVGLGDRGKLKRIVAALESLNSATYTGTLERRFELAINAFTWPDVLNVLSLDTPTIADDAEEDDPVASIVGATSGSTITLHAQSVADLFVLDGDDIVLGAGVLAAGTPTITLRETKTGALNTPRDTIITITVTEAEE